MRTQLTALLLAISCLCSAGEKATTMNIILGASNESQIKEWARDNGTSSRILKFKGDGRDVIVLLVDTASGLIQEDIYVFYFEKDAWNLCLLRLTNGKVEVEATGKKLVFKNPKGTVLVEQPFASMRIPLTASDFPKGR